MIDSDDLQTHEKGLAQSPPTDPVLRKRHFRQLAMLAAGFTGLICLFTVGAASWYFFRMMPEDTYTAISGDAWEARNVNLMAFKTPQAFRQAESTLLDELHGQGKSEDPVPYFLLAELYNMEQRNQDAIPRYREAIRLGSRSWFHSNLYRHFLIDANAKLAILYYEGNDYKAALSSLNNIGPLKNHPDGELLSALKDSLENPDRADFHMNLGRSLRHYLKLGKARSEIEEARALSKSPQLRMEADNFLKTQMPRHVAELPALARYYSLAGDARQYEHDDLWQAATFYEKAVKEVPRFEWGYNELAIIYRQLKDYRKAGNYARSAISLNPQFYNSHLTMGDIALDSNNFDEAVSSYEKARELIQNMPSEDNEYLLVNIENQLGFAYESMDRTDEAIQHYRQAMLRAGRAEGESAEADYDYAQDAIERISEAQKTRQANDDGKRISSL